MPDDFSGIFSGSEKNTRVELGAENQTLDEVEKAVVERSLVKHKGNISKVAKELGLTRTSLYRRIEKYEL